VDACEDGERVRRDRGDRSAGSPGPLISSPRGGSHAPASHDSLEARNVPEQSSDQEDTIVERFLTTVREDWRLLLAAVPLLVAAIFYQPLFELDLGIGSVRIEPIDLPMLLAVALGLPVAARMWRELWRSPGVVAMLAIVVVLALPILIGLAAGNDLQSVLRGARLTLAFATFVALLPLIAGRRQVRLLLWVIFWLTVVAAVFGGLARMLGVEWANGMSLVPVSGGVISRGFGWWSAMPWYALSVTMAAAYLMVCDSPPWRRAAILVIGAFVFGTSLATLVRSQLLGVVLGLLCVAVLLVIVRRSLGWRRVVLRLGVVLVGLAAGGLFFAWALSPPTFTALAERTTSIVASGASSEAADVNRNLRVLAIQEAAAVASEHPFGLGYGRDSGAMSMHKVIRDYWSTHSGAAWPLFVLGWVGTALLAAALAFILVLAFRWIGSGTGEGWSGVAVLGVTVCLIGQSAGASYAFSQMYVFPLVPILVAMALREATLRRSEVRSSRDVVASTDAGRRSAAGAARRLLDHVTGLRVARGLLLASLGALAFAGAGLLIGAATGSARIEAALLGPPSGAYIPPSRTSPGPIESIQPLPWATATLNPTMWRMRSDEQVGGFVDFPEDGEYGVSAVSWGRAGDGSTPFLRLLIDGVPQGEDQEAGIDFRISTWRVRVEAGIHLVAVSVVDPSGHVPLVGIADLRVWPYGGTASPTPLVTD